MERGEPALVPQWYKLGNGNTSNNALRTNSLKRSDEVGVGLGSRNRLLGDQDRNLQSSLSSNGSLSRDKGTSSKSQAYSNFRRSRERNQEKDFDSRDSENRSVLLDDGFDYRDSFLGVRAEKDASRHSQSMIAARQVDSWPKRPGSSANNSASSRGVIGSISKTSFDKDFPSLRAEGRQSFSDGGGVSPVGLKTAVQSLPVASPVVIGTSALVEIPVKVETNGTISSPVGQAAPICQAYSAGSTTTGLNMAEALAQTPSQVVNTAQLSIDTQRIEELTLRKCKQLIPMTPSMPKASSCNSSEKIKSKVARGGDFGSLMKIGQQSHVNLTVRPTARSDITKASLAGNFQVLNREKNGISPTAKDGPNIGKATNPIGLAPSSAVLSLKSPTDQNLKVDNKNGASTHNSIGERKLLSQVRNRNDFFNLLRKKSLTNSSAIPEPSSMEPASIMSEDENSQITSLVNMEKNCLSPDSGLDSSTETTICLNGDFCDSDESEGSYADNKESNHHSDIAVDPEEEAFLRSLGWDKNAGEEALTKEEIDAFLKKYEKQRPLKIVPADL